MTPDQREWSRTRDELIDAVTFLGFPKELGDAMAKNLGSPKAMRRMIAYLYNEKPKTAEIAVDEMLAMLKPYLKFGVWQGENGQAGPRF